ncbi:hypothetical protein N7468_005245 [Penicillium chermesinum]|uniref:Integral membrane protein n=1 Tax=Penicillium chermesinum TaxID=63820 RepID=A0A9W9NYV9_9EURO|nr:uncharacterized protein N7468_005245 [Penicillium chermesinum]KAJ5232289.1 hypothetical protein N7468_005245 [Penicillium chermesinum]KAJ6171941.1 hypothetical protein N7470_001008 [Penicillium chermesinum]
MGKASRIACIFTPGVLTIAALISIIFVGLGCTKASSSTLNDLYFLRVDLQNISNSNTKTASEVENILNEHGITSVSASQVSDLIKKLQDDSTLKDFYDIGLLGYCEGDITDNKYTVTSCSKPKAEFYFNPLTIWGLNSTTIKDELPDDYDKIINIYKNVSKWMYIAYLIAFIVTIVEIVVGFFAICSRWGSCVTTIVAFVGFLFTAAASITATVIFSVFRGSLGKTLDAYGISLSLGKNAYIATWFAVAFSLGALVFWTFSVCCCSGRSPYNHKNKDRGLIAEKAPYTYEPIGGQQPYGNQPYGYHTSYPPPPPGESYPMAPAHHQGEAYEPFRHS